MIQQCASKPSGNLLRTAFARPRFAEMIPGTTRITVVLFCTRDYQPTKKKCRDFFLVLDNNQDIFSRIVVFCHDPYLVIFQKFYEKQKNPTKIDVTTKNKNSDVIRESIFLCVFSLFKRDISEFPQCVTNAVFFSARMLVFLFAFVKKRPLCSIYRVPGIPCHLGSLGYYATPATKQRPD